MIGLIFNLTIVVILVMLAFVRPGAGIAVALALGRHTFPDRSSPIVAAAPLLLFAACLGLYQEGRRLRLTVASVVAAVLIAVVTLVGYMVSSGTSDDAIQFLNNDKTFFLLAVSVPLVLLAPSLSDWIVRRDFLLALVLIPMALVFLSVLSGSSEESGRSTALGGGPITLATACGLAILILLFHDDALVPSMFSALSRPFRMFSTTFLVAGMFLTGSRQPVLSLVLVLGMASFTAASTSSAGLVGADARRRIRRIRAGSVFLVGIGAASLFAFITAKPDSRFALLLDPTAELRRSRLGVWQAGLDRVADGPLLGHGFGSFVTYQFPYDPLDYPHNLFIELMSETGLLIGGVASLAIVWAVVASRRGSIRVIWLLAAFALLGVQFSGDLYNSRYLMFFIVAALTVRVDSLQGDDGSFEEKYVRDSLDQTVRVAGRVLT